jgi:phosphoribosyl-ATP pyrophosphohydrolase/phosphoribosyl-AMP cyclohydrolase
MKANFKRNNGLLPVIVQDFHTGKVLMHSFMNEAAYTKTKKNGKVTFFSRSRKKLWTKGETSGNYLIVKDMILDCDQDSLLIKAESQGSTCHTGQDTCFGEHNRSEHNFLFQLEEFIAQRKKKLPPSSYTTKLFKAGLPKIAKKVGEESTELIIEAFTGDPDRMKQEAADLIYHLLVLLRARAVPLIDVIEILNHRHSKK